MFHLLSPIVGFFQDTSRIYLLKLMPQFIDINFVQLYKDLLQTTEKQQFKVLTMQDVLKWIEELFTMECPICYCKFDIGQNYPYLICSQQHVYCRGCFNSHFTNHTNTSEKSVNLEKKLYANCPECREEVERENIKEFRLFKNIHSLYNRVKIKIEEQQIQKEVKKDLIRKAHAHNFVQVEDSIKECFKQIELAFKKTQKEDTEAEEGENIVLKTLNDNIQELVKLKIESIADKAELLAEDLDQQADLFIRDKCFEQAIFSLKKIIELYPKRKCTFLGFGNKENHIGYFQQEAHLWYIETCKKLDHKVSAHDMLSLCCAQSPNQQPHKKWYKEMLEKDPTHELFFGLANIEYNLGNYKQARQIYLKLVDLMPSCRNLYLYIAFTYYREKKIKEARHYAFNANKNQKFNLLAEFIFAVTEEKLLDQVDHLEQIILAEKNYARAWYAIGQTYYKLNRLEDSAKYLKKCIEISPLYVKPYFMLGKLFYEVTNFKQSFQQFQKCIKLEPHHKKAYCFLGNILLRSNRPEKAIECYQRDLDYSPDQTRAYENIALAYKQLRQFEKCVEILTKGLEKYPKDKNLNLALAEIYQYFRRDVQAIGCYLKCIELGCEATSILPKIVDAYTEANMIKQAITYAQKWKSLVPDNPNPIKCLRDLYIKLDSAICTKGWQPQKKLK